MQSKDTAINRLSIEGPVILKRKSKWVRRIAKIENCIFTYKIQQSDKKTKGNFDLRKAKVMLGEGSQMKTGDSSPYIYIQPNPLKSEIIRIMFDKEAQFNQWLQVVHQSRKSDQKLKEMMASQNESNQEIKEPKRVSAASFVAQEENILKKQNDQRQSMLRQSTIRRSYQPKLFQMAVKYSDQSSIDKIIENFGDDWFLFGTQDSINLYCNDKNQATAHISKHNPIVKVDTNDNKNLNRYLTAAGASFLIGINSNSLPVQILSVGMLAGSSFCALSEFTVSDIQGHIMGRAKVAEKAIEIDYSIKAQFSVITNATEVLKHLLDHQLRILWDVGLDNAQSMGEIKELHAYYKNGQQGQQLVEKIKFQYIYDSSKFYINEIIASPFGTYNHVWILEKINNQPQAIRITFLSEIKSGYTNYKSLHNQISSLSALRNLLEMSDRAVDSKGRSESKEEQNSQQLDPFADEALDLVQEDFQASEDEISEDEDEEFKDVPIEEDVVYEEDYTLQNPLWHWESVPDWSKRIKAYSDEQKEFYNDMIPKVQELKGLVSSDQGWERIVDDKKQDVTTDIKRSVRGFYIMRAQGWIDFPPVDIMRLISNKKMKQTWDLNNEVTQSQKKIGVNAYVIYSKSIKRFVISSRDFVVNSILNTEADGTVYYCASSTNCKFKVPETSKAIRGETPISGFYIKPDATNPNRSFLTIINELDLKGGIPDFALKKATQDNGYQISRLRKQMPKWKKENPN